MKYSISNLAWGNTRLDKIIPKLSNAGLHGVEIAPTAIWPDIDQVSDQEILEFKEYLQGHNLVVSGIQSLLYGHPELQLFDQKCWVDLKKHLETVIRIGGLLGADVAVFGSPKNRVKGILELEYADELAKTFLNLLNPCLKENNIILTLEPNAPQYGADYLTTYEEVVNLSTVINSKNIRPQIDTGCLWMVGIDSAASFLKEVPHHIHLSIPNLAHIPGPYNFDNLLNLAQKRDYSGWLVLEMVFHEINDLAFVTDSANWLVNRMRIES